MALKKRVSDMEASMAFIKQLIAKIFALKFFYIGSVMLFALLAILQIKYSTKVYELSSTIGPLKDSRATALADVTSGYNVSFRNIEETVNSLYSYELVAKTLNDMHLEVGYFEETKYFLLKKVSEIYLQSPFVVNIDKSHAQPIDVRFYISILSDSTFKITALSKKAFLYNYIDNKVTDKNQYIKIDTICKFNETLDRWNLKFSLSPNKGIQPGTISANKTYYFELYHPEILTKVYLKSLQVSPASYYSAIINIKFSSNNLTKALDFLNTYINSFLEENLAKKNKIAISTIKFIDSQISEMSDSLILSESELRNFKSEHMVTDLSVQGQRLYDQLAQYESDRSNLEVQSQYYNYLLNHLKANEDLSGIMLPSSAKITDPYLNQLIYDLLAMYSERSSLPNNSEKNLFISQIDNKIKVQRQTILDNVTSSLNTLNISLNEITYKIEKLARDASSLPRKEMNMVDIQRKYNLNNTIYTYLLQQRSEAAIALASTYPDFEVLEPAREVTAKVVKPKIKMTMALALLLGLLIPSLFLLIRELMNDKICTTNDIALYYDKPVFGTVFSNTKKYETVVIDSPGSALAEAFRNIRSSLFLKLKSDRTKVILITSSQPQDGKSFVSVNLASSIASVGAKTVLLDFDLRRPVLHKKLLNENSPGISNFMINNATEKEIIHGTKVENLYFIPAGPILPNSSELINREMIDALFNYLKNEFEYILIDTPPIALVSDPILLMKYASAILMVVRSKVTKKDVFKSALGTLDLNGIDNYEIILNDYNLETSPYANYKDYYHHD